MAVMRPESLPTWIVSDPRRSGEIALYVALRDRLSTDYRAYYHFPWVEKSPGRSRPSEGEADFILAHPAKGVLLIEVKGGRIGHDGVTGLWTSTDRDGVVHAIDPFEQLRRCKHALIEKIRSCPLWRGNWVEIGHAVCFPHCASGQWASTADAPQDIIISGDDLGRLDKKVSDVFEYWRRTDTVCSLGTDGMMALESVVAPTFSLPQYETGLALNLQEQRILELTQEQFDVLELLRQVPRVAVQGGAGTGKTILAMEKARRASRSGRRTLLVCFNRPLADFMQRSLSPTDGLQVCSFHQLCYSAAMKAGVQIAEPYAREMPSRYYETDLPMALFEATANSPTTRFDTIIVDEGQDFQAGWWEVLGYLLADELQSEFYIFFDGNQRIYGNRADLPKAMVPVNLTRNLRNTRQVFDLVKRFNSGQSYTSAGPEGIPIERIEANSPREVAKSVGRVLHRVANEFHQPPHQVCILSGGAVASCSLVGADRVGAFRLTADHDGPPDAVLLETIHRFKGLEKPVVIVIDLEKAMESRELCYVGFSRARLLLFLIASGPTLRRVCSDTEVA